MSFPALALTNDGKALLLKNMAGDSIVFSRIGLGNGEEPEDISKVTEMSNFICNGEITSFERKDTYAIIHWTLDTASITDEFYWKEYALFAKDSEGNEFLYSYAYDNDRPQPLSAASSASLAKLEVDINVALGTAENVSAVIGEYSAYASKETVEEHINNQSNPHRVTAEQIGLGNVDNVSTDMATPSFEEAGSLENIESGETVSTLWGKVKKTISSLVSHINNKSNPHGVTISQIGGAASTHSHSTTDIISGVLNAARGGTGYSSVSALLSAYGLTNMQLSSHYHNSSGGSFVFQNELKIQWDRIAVTASANSVGSSSVKFSSGFFTSTPFVFVTAVTAAPGKRNATVGSVSSSGYTVYAENDGSSEVQIYVNILIIGY